MKLAILAICSLLVAVVAAEENVINGDATSVNLKDSKRNLFGFSKTTTRRPFGWWWTTTRRNALRTTTTTTRRGTTTTTTRRRTTTTTTRHPTTTTTTRKYHFENGNGKDACETDVVVRGGKTCRGWVSETMQNAKISITKADDALQNYWNARRWVARNIQGCQSCDTTLGAGTTTTFQPKKVSKCLLCTRQCASICNLVYSDDTGLGNEQACTYCNAGCLDTCRKTEMPVCKGDKHPKALCESVKEKGFCKDNDSKLKGRVLQLNSNKLNGNAGAHSNWVLGIVDGCCATCGNGRMEGPMPQVRG